MPYQYKREPLTQEEAERAAKACETFEERLVVWTLLDTGLRVGEVANLTRDNIEWQGHRIMITGKGSPYGKRSKRRIVPVTSRIQAFLENHLATHDTLGMTPRTIQRIVKRAFQSRAGAAQSKGTAKRAGAPWNMIRPGVADGLVLPVHVAA